MQHRSRRVKVKAKGAGKCPKPKSKRRMQFRKCNRYHCPKPKTGETVKCEAKLDVIVMVDGSGSLGEAGWEASVEAAKLIVGGFQSEKADAQVAVMLYSGPRTWAALHLCSDGPAPGQPGPDLEKDCGISWVTSSEDNKSPAHFTKDIKDAVKDTGKMEWPAATTMTSLALATAADELKFGRKDAAAVVLVITDGRPMSPEKTFQESKNLRKKARLMWVPVTQYAPIADIKGWASKPLSENVIQVKSFDDFKNPATCSSIIENLCPKVEVPESYYEEAAAYAKSLGVTS